MAIRAVSIIEKYNPKAIYTISPTLVNIIEDIRDPDGRMYRVEYESTLNGSHANAWCRSNPWNRADPSCGKSYHDGHVGNDGFLCLHTNATRTLPQSPIGLEVAIQRVRYWTIAFSVFMETGTFPQP